MLKNDSDPDGDAITAVLVTPPAFGTLTFNANGTFTYSPKQNYNGSDSFTYQASDGTRLSNPVTVSLTITPVNDAPVAVADSYTIGTSNTFAANVGLLTNDSDVDGDPLTVHLIAGPKLGTLSLNANGSFTYTPGANFTSTDSFTYRAYDGKLESATTTVQLIGLLRMTTTTSTVTTVAGQSVGGSFDVDLLLAQGQPLSAAGYQVVLKPPTGSGIHFVGVDAATQSPLFPGQTPQFTISPTDGTLMVTDLSAGSTPLFDGAHLFHVRYTVDPTSHGSFTPVFNTSLTALANPSGDPLPLLPPSASAIQVVDGVPPTVTAVSVRGSQWTSSFISYLNSNGLGSNGYSLPLGTAPLPLPWTNLDQVVVRFSEDVQVSTNSLTIAGVNTANYAVSSVAYDPNTFTATWTLASALPVDSFQIVVSGTGTAAVKDRSGNSMDGIGNGTASDFHQRVDVLPGDVDRSGATNAMDVVKTRNLQFAQIGQSNYSPYADVNGSGIVDIFDVVKVRNAQGVMLPPPSAAGSATATSTASAVSAPAPGGSLVILAPNTYSSVTPGAGNLGGGSFGSITTNGGAVDVGSWISSAQSTNSVGYIPHALIFQPPVWGPGSCAVQVARFSVQCSEFPALRLISHQHQPVMPCSVLCLRLPGRSSWVALELSTRLMRRTSARSRLTAARSIQVLGFQRRRLRMDWDIPVPFLFH